MNRSQIIVVNIVASYARSIVCLSVALFSSRWVLAALGVSDFGLFYLVGAVIVFVTFIRDVMSSSVARHYAYAIGRNDESEVSMIFNSACCLHTCFAFFCLTLGWPIGEYVIGHYLRIEPGRAIAAIWVFRISLISAFVSTVSIPFTGMFTARQRIAEMSVYEVIQALLTLLLTFSLGYVVWDKLIFYSVGMTGIIVVIQILMIFRARTVFPECRISLSDWFNARHIKQLSSYAGWNLFGNIGILIKGQGITVLLNLYFGTAMNAAYSISGQVFGATNQLSSALMGAFSPEITASEGRGDRARMLYLSQEANKFGTILIILFAAPLFVEMDYVLTLWLRTPPEYTAVFCRLVIIGFIIDRLSCGYLFSIFAYGKVGPYQFLYGILLALTVPIAWVAIRLGCPPTSVLVVSIFTIILCTASRVFWVKRYFGVPYHEWLVKTIIPCFMVLLLPLAAGLLLAFVMPSSFLRLMLVSSVTLVVALVTVWFFATDENERAFLLNVLSKVFRKVHSFFQFSGRK